MLLPPAYWLLPYCLFILLSLSEGGLPLFDLKTNMLYGSGFDRNMHSIVKWFADNK